MLRYVAAIFGYSNILFYLYHLHVAKIQNFELTMFLVHILQCVALNLLYRLLVMH